MPSHRARSTARTSRRLVGGAALAGTAMVGLAGAANAAVPDLVPDAAPLLTAHNDVQPDPAPDAPPVEPSFTAFDADDPINQLRDFTPGGVPATGLVDSLGDAPAKIIPSGGGSGGGAGYE